MQKRKLAFDTPSGKRRFRCRRLVFLVYGRSTLTSNTGWSWKGFPTATYGSSSHRSAILCFTLTVTFLTSTRSPTTTSDALAFLSYSCLLISAARIAASLAFLYASVRRPRSFFAYSVLDFAEISSPLKGQEEHQLQVWDDAQTSNSTAKILYSGVPLHYTHDTSSPLSVILQVYPAS